MLRDLVTFACSQNVSDIIFVGNNAQRKRWYNKKY